MKLYASEKRLNKCLKKHVRNPGEPWELLLKQSAAEVRRAFQSGNGLADIHSSVRQLLAAQLSVQLSLSQQRPMYATYRQQEVNADGRLVGRVQPALHFVTPSKMVLICERMHNEKCRLLTAYFPRNAKSWKDAAQRLLNRYCKAKHNSYQLPTEPKRIRQDWGDFQRDVEVTEVQLHVPKQFGVRETRGTRVDRWNPPRWPEADQYESGKQPKADYIAFRFDSKFTDQPLRGGLER